MSTAAVELHGVWKKFRRGENHRTLRDAVPAFARAFLGMTQPSARPSRDFWALRDVNFQVQRGEALGIIGPNGAGKSTLLKMLSKILRPTAGSIQIRGRLRALIEVTAGFHNDLTGRENIYLNGAILGMTKREIDARLDDIIAFSGIEPFLDTPVKRYSSGMQARLGFSVATHMDPEILLVDEVLSVGDALFRAKCVQRMQELKRNNHTTLIFVSHYMPQLQALCPRAVVLRRGEAYFVGDSMTAATRYHEVLSDESQQARGNDFVKARAFGDGQLANGHFLMGAPISFEIELTRLAEIGAARLAVAITDGLGHRICAIDSRDWRVTLPTEGVVRLNTNNVRLLPGRYRLDIGLLDRDGMTQLVGAAGAAVFVVSTQTTRDFPISGLGKEDAAVFWDPELKVASDGA